MTRQTAKRPRAGRRVSYAAAACMLAERDPVIARLVAETGMPRIGRPRESHFAALIRGIVSQQLAEAAAAAIYRRLVTALDGDVDPGRVLAIPDRRLRGVGLSGAKATAVKDLAVKVQCRSVVLSPRSLAQRTDDEIVGELSAVRGIGPWTAQMFLMWQLRGLDVWPTGDLGSRRGYGLAWRVPTPTARTLEPLGE